MRLIGAVLVYGPREMPPAALDGNRLRFLLSAGRTGTLFLSRALADPAAGIRTAHEPWPGRWELWLGNLRERVGAGQLAMAALLRRTRQARLDRLERGDVLVEINPLLCPVADLLAELVAPLHVAHVVREPAAWAESITQFGSQGWRRHLIDYVPLGKPYPQRRPPDWRHLPESERALWRWRYCNQAIERIAERCRSYGVVRYEDLFAADPEQRGLAAGRLYAALGLPTPAGGLALDTEERVNPTPPGRRRGARVSREAARRVCGELAARYGYGS